MPQEKSVLVIGGGAAGSLIAYQLRDLATVTLVDPKTYWEVPMAMPRLLVAPEALPARMRYDSFLGRARHVQGTVTELSDTQARIRLHDGGEQSVAFDYAVIASGSAYVDPLIKAQATTEAGRQSEINAMHERLKTARTVVVAGGGPVGVEIAAEIRQSFGSVTVTLVHGGKTLLERAPSRFPGWAERTLRAQGVVLIANDIITEPAPGQQPANATVRTASGRRLDADVLIWAAGIKPMSGYIARSWPHAVQPDGQLKVDRFLRLEGHPAIFVAGDAANTPEARLAIIGGLHAKSVVGNLKRLLAAQPDAPGSARASSEALKPYKPASPGKGMGKMMIVTLGRNDGLTSLPFGQFRAGFLARKIKSRDMLVGMSRKSLGLLPSPAPAPSTPVQ